MIQNIAAFKNLNTPADKIVSTQKKLNTVAKKVINVNKKEIAIINK